MDLQPLYFPDLASCDSGLFSKQSQKANDAQRDEGDKNRIQIILTFSSNGKKCWQKHEVCLNECKINIT